MKQKGKIEFEGIRPVEVTEIVRMIAERDKTIYQQRKLLEEAIEVFGCGPISFEAVDMVDKIQELLKQNPPAHNRGVKLV